MVTATPCDRPTPVEQPADRCQGWALAVYEGISEQKQCPSLSPYVQLEA